MSAETPTGKTYTMGDVGAGATVVQGDYNQVMHAAAGSSDGAALKQRFDALLAKIETDQSLDPSTREIAGDKVKAVAVGLAGAEKEPGRLVKALIDAKAFFGSVASWVGTALGDVLKSEAAQKTIGTITESAAKATIASFIG